MEQEPRRARFSCFPVFLFSFLFSFMLAPVLFFFFSAFLLFVFQGARFFYAPAAPGLFFLFRLFVRLVSLLLLLLHQARALSVFRLGPGALFPVSLFKAVFRHHKKEKRSDKKSIINFDHTEKRRQATKRKKRFSEKTRAFPQAVSFYI